MSEGFGIFLALLVWGTWPVWAVLLILAPGAAAREVVCGVRRLRTWMRERAARAEHVGGYRVPASRPERPKRSMWCRVGVHAWSYDHSTMLCLRACCGATTGWDG